MPGKELRERGIEFLRPFDGRGMVRVGDHDQLRVWQEFDVCFFYG